MSCLSVIIACLIPVDPSASRIDFDHWDKVQHAIAYAFLSFLGLKAFSNHAKGVLAGLCIMGAVIEIIQEATGWRSGEGLDLAANATGIFLVYGISQLRTVGNQE